MTCRWFVPITTLLLWVSCVHFDLLAAAAVDAAPTSVIPKTTNDNASEWWTGDHPYFYKHRYKRLPNGSIVLNDDDEVTFQQLRATLSAQPSSPLVEWLSRKETRKTIKQGYRFMLYNFVPSSLYGDAVTRMRTKALQSKMKSTFFLHEVAIPGVKMIGTLLLHALKSHYGTYIEREKLFKRLQLMTAAEISAEFNIPLPEYDLEAELETQRPNHTLPYDWKGSMQIFNGFGERFVPYANYSQQYYAVDEDLPPPVLPAASYPWLWSERLAIVRELMLRIMAINARHADQDMEQIMVMGEQDGNGSIRQRLRSHGSSASVSSSVDADIEDVVNGDEDNGSALEALEELEQLTNEYHFATGIPRIVRLNHSHSPFPSLASFLNESASSSRRSHTATNNGSSSRGINHLAADTFAGMHHHNAHVLNGSSSEDVGFDFTGDASTIGTSPFASTGSESQVPASNASAEITKLSVAGSANASTNSVAEEVELRESHAERSRRTRVYEAMRQFYSYPSVDTAMAFYPTKDRETMNGAKDFTCSLVDPCLVQSSVTVYTPSLNQLNFFQTVVAAKPAISPEQQRRTRIEALQDMIAVAFQAERRALQHGIQPPSTVWYSLFDRNVDEFADAIVGFVNATVRGGGRGTDGGEVAPLHVYTSLAQDTKGSIFYTLSSYYSSTILDTIKSMKTRKAEAMLEALTEAEQIEVITFVANKMAELDEAISMFVHARNADDEYQALVNATISQEAYRGCQYSTLGFGFLAPATNKQNVLYRDMRLPVPFHLVLRLFVRFQESRLLLPEESYHMLTCLAMLRNDISYYRCRPNVNNDRAQ